MDEIVSLLERPVYTSREVDRLLGLNPDTAKRWINGYRRNGREYDPIVREEPTDNKWVTWGEFIETRLLSEYRDINEIKIVRMRRVVAALREYYHRRYPLAYARPFVKVEDRQVVARVQEETGLDSQVWMVADTGQYTLAPRANRFYQATTYGPDPDAPDQGDEVAVEVSIDPRYPDVKLNPMLRSGRPTIAGRNIYIATLAGMVLDGDPVSKVGDWYDRLRRSGAASGRLHRDTQHRIVSHSWNSLISNLIPLSALDKHWIPVAAEHGWVAITNDHHMRTRYYEASLALKHGLMVVNIKGVGHRSAWDQLVRLTKHWQSVERFIDKNPAGPWWLSLTDSSWRQISYRPDGPSL